MDQALFYHRFHFAFTASYHYLFPQLTMGLALLIVVLKGVALRTGEERWDRAAVFWGRIFGLAFVMGVVTGIPMEFQFGTNWARFSEATGGVIGQTLAMEGVFAFFLESSFLALFLFGREKLGPRGHMGAAVAVWLGSWISGFFIVATNAFMQHPVGYEMDEQGRMVLASLGGLLGNPWLLWQYIHTMAGAVVTGSFVMAAVGAYYLLSDEGSREAPGPDAQHGRLFLRVAVPAGLVASILLAFPTGDRQALNVARHQPPTFAAMEGLFHTGEPAPLVLIGQPDMADLRLDNPLEVPAVLSFLTYRRWDAPVEGLTSFPREDWPDNVPLLYYAYHLMVGLGTLFILAMAVAAFLLWRGRLATSRPVLWVLMLLAPFPFIANTTGWMTAELGRQPWTVWGLMRTSGSYSQSVGSGNALFSLIGFMGLYLVLGILFLFLAQREIAHGPAALLHASDAGSSDDGEG
jgi:cytochrome d ubiquinol oxidase subunit I